MSALHIVFPRDIADQVRGPTAPGAALVPIALADGVTFALPTNVLEDPAHVMHRTLLAACATRIVLEAEWSPLASSPPD
ncbi:hypothetical protein V5F77_15170 [Xanthobacter sp. DSM 24535]|uniref:hypothetical protein n=1 Tax=Roseixanthobacter psychrophilus TaxID=3119917 RepID=UPI003727AA69